MRSRMEEDYCGRKFGKNVFIKKKEWILALIPRKARNEFGGSGKPTKDLRDRITRNITGGADERSRGETRETIGGGRKDYWGR